MRSIKSFAVAGAVVAMTFGAIGTADAQHGRGGGWRGGGGASFHAGGATFGSGGIRGGGWSNAGIRGSAFRGGVRSATVSGTFGNRGWNGGWSGNRGFRTANVAGTWAGRGWNRGWNPGFRTAAVAGTWGGGWNRGWHGGWRGNRWGGWGWGPAIATGLAFGAVATAPYWDAGYYDYAAYDCGPQFVTYGPWGGGYVSDACYY